jgi:uncharacterized protein
LTTFTRIPASLDDPERIVDTFSVVKASRGFQVFVKPAGPACNLRCRYCYYLEKAGLFPDGTPSRMPDALLERYITQHFEASPEETVRFSWHGGEPTILGKEYFCRIVDLQRRHCPAGRRFANGIQTNGLLLDEGWGRFLAAERFTVGLSLDGPEDLHDLYRRTADGRPSFAAALRGYEILRRFGLRPEILCVVNAVNAGSPAAVYGFFKSIEAAEISFLPLVRPRPEEPDGLDPLSVRAESWGAFLCAVFDEWVGGDIGRVKIQIIEEAARVAFGQEHSLCLFRPTCGDIPVVERNGDVYPCDHFVEPARRIGNIGQIPLGRLLASPAQKAFGRAKRETLPRICRTCEVLSMCAGECPKNRFARTPDGESGWNVLCPGYKRFFTHIRPFVDEVAAEWRRQSPGTAALRSSPPGRNDPCPCGSGRKYKKCCLIRPG